MANEISQEVLDRAPTNPKVREPQGLSTPEPSPDKPPQDEEKESLRSKNEELTKALKLKDKAIEDAKGRIAERDGKIEELTKPKVTTEEVFPSLEDEMQARVKKLVAEQAAAEIERRMEPFKKQVGRAEQAERDAQESAAKAYAGDGFEEYRTQAEQTRAQNPNLSLAQCYRLVMPEGKAKTMTIPATPVEPSRTPAPAQPKTAQDEYNAHMAAAAAAPDARTRTFHQTQALKGKAFRHLTAGWKEVGAGVPRALDERYGGKGG